MVVISINFNDLVSETVSESYGFMICGNRNDLVSETVRQLMVWF